MLDRAAFLRAVNVAGRQIAMADLCNLFAHIGLGEAKTLLQSGNVAFSGGRRSDAALERLLESETQKRFGFSTAYMVRSGSDLRQVVAANPFAAEAKRDPGHLVVYFLKESVDRKGLTALQRSWSGPEAFEAAGKHVYVYYPAGIGRSKFKLPWLGTGRNWNTVTKVLALLER